MDKLYANAKERWQDGLNFFLGIWMILSPWVLGFTEVKYAPQNAAVIGVIVAVIAAWALIASHEWEEWVSMALGLWLIATPWLFAFATIAPTAETQAAFIATWNFVIVGVLVAGLAIWSTYNMRKGGGTLAT